MSVFKRTLNYRIARTKLTSHKAIVFSENGLLDNVKQFNFQAFLWNMTCTPMNKAKELLITCLFSRFRDNTLLQQISTLPKIQCMMCEHHLFIFKTYLFVKILSTIMLVSVGNEIMDF